jgi:hypothetical protein
VVPSHSASRERVGIINPNFQATITETATPTETLEACREHHLLATHINASTRMQLRHAMSSTETDGKARICAVLCPAWSCSYECNVHTTSPVMFIILLEIMMIGRLETARIWVIVKSLKLSCNYGRLIRN